MNHIYRLKRSGRTQQLQPVPETARSAGKGQSRGLRALAVVVSASLAHGLLGGVATLVHAQQAPPAPLQLPQGGVVTHGSASIQSSTGAEQALMTVNQASPRAVIDWASFNVGSQAKVQFNQPSSSAVVLNHILGSNASQIYGQISANGQVFLSNPNGIYFSPTAQVNVGGLVATTGRANADEFMAGTSVFHREGSTASVVNEGRLSADPGGYIALLAPEVRNQGVVVAQAGTVALGSGEAITLHFNNAGTGLVGLTTTPQAIAALVDNRSAVLAEGGQIILSAHALATLQGAVIKNSGQLSATSLVNRGGKVVLMADTIELAGTSQIEANGPSGGGTVLVGGDWQGQGDTRQAIRVTMEPGARIEANATQQGDGGKVVLWSDISRPDSVTRVEGRIEATGAGTGQGGQVETSGYHLQVDDLRVNTEGAGSSGQWLLDPSDISISTGTTANITNTSNTWTPNSGAATSVINATTLLTNLGSNNITITTTNAGSAGSGTGNISIDTSLSWSSSKTLTLVASGGISGTGSITMNGIAGTGVVFNQAGNSTYSGAIAGTNATFTLTGGGTLNLTGSNSYGGSTTISAGTLQIGGTGRLGSGTYSAAISNNGTLQYSSSSAQSLSGVISGTGALIKDTSTTSMLTLGGANTYSGSTTVQAGTLRVGAGSNIGSLATSGVSVASGANFQINRSDAVTVAYPISGAGSFSKAGTSSSVTILTGDNSYTGGTNILAGVLELGSANAIGPSGPITFSTTSTQLATLRYPSSSAVNASDYSSRLDSTTTGQFYKINTNGQNITFASPFGNASSTFEKLGNGTLTITASNAFSGTTTITTGTLQLGDGGTTGELGSGMITNNSTLTFNRSNALTVGNTITGSGAVVKAGSGTTTLSVNNNYTGTTTVSAGTLQVGNGGVTGTLGSGNFITNGTLSFNRSDTATFSQSISGTGGVSQIGTGTLTLTGAKTYTGTTYVGQGTLDFAGSSTSSTSASNLVVDANGTFTFSTAGQFFKNLSGTGTVYSIGGNALNIGYDNTNSVYTGVFLGNATNGFSLQKYGTGTFTFTGSVSNYFRGFIVQNGTVQVGNGDASQGRLGANLQVGSGNAVINFNDSFTLSGYGTGTVTLMGSGTAVVSSNTGFSGAINLNGGVLSLASTGAAIPTSGGTISFGGGTLQYANAAEAAADRSARFSSAANQTYKIDTNGQNVTFATPLTSPGGTLTKLGAGTLILTGTPGGGNTIYSGQTTISAGVLQIGNGSVTAYMGTGPVVNDATLTINLNTSASIPGALSGAGALNKLGTGFVELSGANSSFTGPITLTAGSLRLSSANALGTLGNISFAGGTLEYASSAVADYSGRFSSASGQTYRLSATTGVNVTLASAFGGGAANGNALIKTGAGSVTLAAANTYTGLTTVSAGTLAVTHAQGLGTTDAGVTLNGGALDLQNVAVVGEAITVNNVAGNSIMTSTGSSSLNGNITVNGGLTVNVGATQLLLSGAVSVPATATSLTKTGSGKLIFTSSSNGINGNITIAEGTLNVGNGGSTGNVGTPASLTVNGVLEVDRSDGFSLGSIMNVQNNTVGTGNVRIASGGALTIDKSVRLTGAASTIDLSASGSMGLSNVVISTSGATGQINISSNAGVTFTGMTVNASSGTAGATASIKILAGANQLAGIATGGDIGFAGSATLFQTAAGGTVTLFQGNANTTALNGKITGASGTKKYKTYSASSASLSAAVTGTRNFFYRAAGSGSVTVSNVVATKTYDGTTNAVGFITGGTITGLTGEDALTGALPTFTTANFNSADAGTGKTLTLSGVSVANSDWSIAGLTATLGGGSSGTINKANATVTANSGNFTYNGSLQSISGFTATGLVNGETEAVLTGVSAGGSGTNFGTYATTASGTATNYNLSFVNGTLSIGKANLTRVTATKVYDGLLTVSAGDMQVIEGLNGDTFTATAGTAAISDKNVLTSGNTLTSLAGLTLSGVGAALPSNYNLAGLPAAGANNTVTITPRALGITGIVGNNKPYDGTTSATVSTAGAVRTGLISGDTVNVSATGTFSTASVGTGKTVTLVSSYSGADLGNYTITGQSTATANIEPKPLALSIPGATRAYDGTTAILPTGPIGLSGVIGSEDVALSSGSVTGFVDKNVGTNKTVVYTGFTLTGTLAGNYSLPVNPASTANITALNLPLTGVGVANKVYDASTAATLNGTAVVNPLSGDVVTVNAGAASASFANKNVGAGKAVTVTGYSLTGTDAGNYNLLQPTGLTANISPASLQVTGLGAADKVYDASTTATLTGTAAVVPLGSDVLSLVGTGTGAFADKNAGTGKPVTVSGYSLSGADAGNYTLVQPTGLTANISRADLAVTGVGVANKVYDATTAAPLNGTPTVTALAGDVVQVTGTGAGAFADKNVGTGKAVTVSGFTLGGTDAGNYNPVQPTGLTADITPAALQISGLTVSNRAYDGTTGATVNTAGAIKTGLLGTDDVTVSATGSFADPNAGTNKTVTLNSSYGGVDVGNYTITDQSTAQATIDPKPLGLNIPGATRVYDGSTNINVSGAVSLSGVLGSDDVSLSSGNVTGFVDKNVGTGKSVLYTGFTLSGTAVGNYTLPASPTSTADITPASLSVNGITGVNKVYDGTATASANVSGAVFSGLLGSDTVLVSATGTFRNGGNTANDQNVGANKTVALSSSYSGADAGNYTITSQATTTADITPKALTISGSAIASKPYDGTTTAVVTVGSLGGLVSGETLTVSGAGSFGSKDVGTYSINTAYTLADGSGGLASNYSLASQTLSASITPKALTISGSGIASKTYDGTTTAVVTAGSLGGLVNGETLTVSGAGTFGSKDVGTYSISAAYTLADGSGGGLASNYSLVNQSLSASITPKALAISGITASNKTYDGLTGALVSTTGVVKAGLIGGDVVTVSAMGVFADKHVGTGKTVNLTSSYGGTDVGNYTITDQASTTANITPAALTISGITAASKTYDGTTGATVSTAGVVKTGLMGGDVVTVSATGAFADKNAGTGKTVNLTSNYAGTDFGNYTITDQASTVADITPKALTISGITAANKTYDGTTAASVSTAAMARSGLVAGDVVNVTVTGAFADKNAADGKAVNLTSSYSGADVGNYTIAGQASTVADITPKALTISGITAAGKTYDGLTDAQVSTAGVVKTGLIGGDVVTVSATGAFADKNAGVGKTVNLTSSYSGADVGNYSISHQSTALANIAQAALTMTAQNAFKLIGQTDPTFAATYSGFVNGETAAVLTGVGVTRTGTDTAANTYTGVLVPTASSNNYTITPVNGNFTIVPADTLLVTLGNASKVYGANVSGLTATSAQYMTGGNVLRTVTLTPGANSSYTYSDGLGTSGSFTLATLANSASGVGNYGITLTNFVKTGTNFTSQVTQDGNLLVNPLAVALGAVSPSKVYDGNTSVQTTVAVTNKVGADDVSVLGVGSYTDNKNVGTTHTYSLSAQLTGVAASNYYLNSSTLTGSNGVITPAALTISGITAAGKTYDGTATASLSLAGLVRSGLIGSDDVTVSATGRFRNAGNTADDKNVGNSKTVQLTSSYGGADAGNYTITGQDSTTASITPAALTISGITAANKTYDGTTAASVSTAAMARSGLVAGDVVNVAVTGAFADKNAGTNKLVSLTSSYSGADVGNYTIAGQASTVADITPKALTISGITATGKTYDGLTDAQVSTAGVVKTGLIGGDVVTVSATGAFADKNAGAGKTVNLSSSFGGSDFGNYTITSQASTTATISPAALTMTAQNAFKLIGQADPVFTALYSGFVNGETAAVLTGAGVVRTGTDTAANTYTGVLVPTGSSSNYTITAVNGNFTIVPADTLLVTLGNVSKVYGAAVPSLTVSSAQYLTGGNVLRNVALTAGANGSYTYSDGLGTTGAFTLSTSAGSASGVGNYAITLDNFVKSGNNFTAQATQDGNLVVNPLAVALGAVSPSKVYDGNTAVQTTVAVANRVGGDDVAVRGMGNFSDGKNVGNTHTYSLSAQLTGVAASNYYLNSSTLTGSNGVITPAAMTISGITAASKTYDGTATASLNLAGLVRSGLLGSDEVTVNATGAFADANVGSGKTVALTISYSGADAGNYIITGQGATTAGITSKSLSLSGSRVPNKVYDGTTTAVLMPGTLTGLVGTQTLAVTGSAAFMSKNVGTQSLTASYTLANAGSGATAGLASNYTLEGETLLASITPKALTVSGIAAADKTYDGTTSADVSVATVVRTGLVPGDAVQVTATGSFADPNAGLGKTVNLVSSYSGADVSNYSISTQTTTLARITPATLQVVAEDATKVQDNQPFAGGNGVRFNGFVSNENSAVLGGTLAYGGSAQGAVNPGSYAITPMGLSSSNYQLVFQDGALTIRSQATSSDANSAALIHQAMSKSDLPSTGSALPRKPAAAFEPAGQDRAASSIQSGGYAWPAIEAVKLAETLDAGLLGVTILRPQGTATAAVMFEQDQDTISIRSAAAPLKNPAPDKVVFSSRMTEFMVEDGNGQLVEFQGGIVNRRMVVVAPSAESKQLAQRSMNTVLAGAIMALGRQNPVLLAKLDGVVLDLR